MKKVLIVEDDKTMHEVYKDIFAGTGERYHLIFAFSVNEATRELDREKIDLVVLDIIMEPLSGAYLYLKLREDDKFKSRKIPVIIVSVIKKQKLEHLEELNDVSILEKPIKHDRFLKEVKKMIG